MRVSDRTLFPTTSRGVISLIDYCNKRELFVSLYGYSPEQYFGTVSMSMQIDGFGLEEKWAFCLDKLGIGLADWYKMLDDESDIKSDKVNNWVE